MSTLELEHLKHTSSSSNNLSMHSDGSLTLGTIAGQISTTHSTISVTNSSYPQLQLNSGVKNYHIFNDTGSNSLYFKNATDNVNAVIIDGSGRVTMPNQPAFHVRLNDVGAQVQVPHTTHTVWENQGGHWNSSTHRFVAPAGGFYYFILSGYTNYSTGHGYIGIRKNGTQIHVGWHWNVNNVTQHVMGGMTAGLTLQVNDYVDFTRPSAGAGSKFDVLNASGWLIG